MASTGGVENSNGRFVETVLELLDSTEYRRCVTGEDREAIGRLRLKAYGSNPKVAGLIQDIHDPYDDAPNAHLFSVFVSGLLVGSLRLHLLTKDCPTGMSFSAFPEVVSELLESGPAIEPARFTADPDYIKAFTLLPYVTLRLAGLAAMYLDAASVVILAREAHIPVYKRIYDAELVAGPSSYPGMDSRAVLMRVWIEDIRQRSLARFPFFDGIRSEGRLLFGPFGHRSDIPLSVVPTARFVKTRDGMASRGDSGNPQAHEH